MFKCKFCPDRIPSEQFKPELVNSTDKLYKDVFPLSYEGADKPTIKRLKMLADRPICSECVKNRTTDVIDKFKNSERKRERKRPKQVEEAELEESVNLIEDLGKVKENSNDNQEKEKIIHRNFLKYFLNKKKKTRTSRNRKIKN